MRYEQVLLVTNDSDFDVRCGRLRETANESCSSEKHRKGAHVLPNVRGHRADEMKNATRSAASEAPGGPRC